MSLLHTHTYTHSVCPSLSLISGRVHRGEGRGHDSITHTVRKAHALHTHTHMKDYCGAGFLLWVMPNTMRNALSKARHCGSVTCNDTQTIVGYRMTNMDHAESTNFKFNISQYIRFSFETKDIDPFWLSSVCTEQ